MASSGPSDGAKLVLNVKLDDKGERGSRTRFVVSGSQPCFFGRKAEELRATFGPSVPIQVIPHNRVSGKHFSIWFDGVTFYCRDVGSSNGTVVLIPVADGPDEEVFLGSKTQRGAPCAMQPLYTILIANELRLVVESITLPQLAGSHLASSAHANAGADATTIASPFEQDLVLHVLRGPGEGTFFILRPGSRYAFGRKSRRAASNAHAAMLAKKSGVRLLELDVPADLAERNLLKHRHVEISFMNERERRATPSAKFKLVARGTTAHTVRGPREAVDLDSTATWRAVETKKDVFLPYDTMFRCGPVVFVVTNNLAAPRKLVAPKLRAVSPSAVSLWWPVPRVETSLRGYVVRVTSFDPDSRAAGASAGPATANESEILTMSQTNSHHVPDLLPGTKYWFQVRATNGAGNGPWSDAVSFTTCQLWSQSDLSTSLSYDDGEDDEASTTMGTASSAGGAGSARGPRSASDAAPLTAAGNSTTESDATISSVLGPLKQVDPKQLKYVKSRFLGQGAQGRVYLVIDTLSGGQYAVKEIDVDPSSPEGAAEIRSNVEMMRQLQDCEHPHIVRYKGVEVLGSMVRVFQEYCASGSLRKMLDDLSESVGFPESLASRYTDQILKGLAYLHAKNVLHRDIKAANVLLQSAGDTTVLKISDFGLADCFSAREELRASTARNLRGTPFFMAPECIHGNAPEYKGDIWAVGCTVFEMITGQPPLIHLGAFRALFFVGRLMREGHKIPQQYAPSPDLADFLECCFKINPAERWDAEQLRRHRWITKHRDPHLMSFSTPVLAAAAAAAAAAVPAAAAAAHGATSTALPAPAPPAPEHVALASAPAAPAAAAASAASTASVGPSAAAAASLDVSQLGQVQEHASTLDGGALVVTGVLNGARLALAFPPVARAASYCSMLSKLHSGTSAIAVHANLLKALGPASHGTRAGVAWSLGESWTERANAVTGDVRRMLTDVARALVLLHSRRLVHGWLSPACVFWSGTEYALAFFGARYLPCPEPMLEFVACSLAPGQAEALTAPEVRSGAQARGSDGAEDVFSFGVLGGAALEPELTTACCAELPSARPAMLDVLKALAV